MKNRLQLNRIPTLFSGNTTSEARGLATEAIETYIHGENFIPLIGEPILARYLADDGKKQPIIAIGVSTGDGAVDYHIIDPAEFREGLANAFAAIATTNAWFNGRCDNIQTQLNDEKGYRKAIKLVQIDPSKFASLGIGDDVRDAFFVTYHKPQSTEPYEDPQPGDPIIKVYKDSVTPEDIEVLEEVISAAFNDLNDRVNRNTEIITQNTGVTVLSGVVQEISNNLDALSAGTVEGLDELNRKVQVISGDVSNCFDGAEYVSSAKTIIFYHGEEEKASIDARDFIKDGMVDDVYVSGSSLVIVFNTDAGKEPIEIPLSEIFDPTILDELTERVDGLEESLVADEEVTAAALNDLNDRIKEAGTEGHEYTDNAIEQLSGVVETYVTYEIETLSGLVTTQIETLSGNILDYVVASEEVTAAALNDLNDRISEAQSGGTEYTDHAIQQLSGSVETYVTNQFETFSGVVETYVTNEVESLSGSLLERIVSDEEVTSAALNDLNDRIGGGAEEAKEYTDGAVNALSANTITYVNEVVETLSGDVVTYIDESVQGLSGDVITYINNVSGDVITYVNESVESFSGSIIEHIVGDEEVIAAAFNDLNDRITDVEEEVRANERTLNNIAGDLNELSAATVSSIDDLNRKIDVVSSGGTIDLANLSGATEAIGNDVDELSGITEEVENKVEDLSGATESVAQELSELSGVTEAVETELTELSGATESVGNDLNELSGATESVAGGLSDLSGATTGLEEEVGGLSDDVTELSGATGNLSAATVALKNASADYFNEAEYVSSAKTIVFSHDGTVLETIDAKDFIKDGMVSSVTVDNGNLVISFNTEAGREDIELPLTDIFDPNNYYTKSDVYSKNEINALSASLEDNSAKVAEDLADLSGSVQSNETKIGDVSGSVVDNKTKLGQLSGAVQADETKISNISGSVIANETNITNLSGAVVDNATEIGAMAVDLSELSASVVYNQAEIQSLSASFLDDEYVVSLALNDLNRRVHELSGGSVDLSNYYTKSEVYNKAETYTKNEIDSKIASGGTFDPTVWNALSGATDTHIKDGDVHVTTVQKTAWTNKQDSISDLATIRSNAQSGASAYTMVKNLSAVTLTGVTVNGVAAPVQNGVAAITVSTSGGTDPTVISGLSAATVAHISDTTVHVTQAEKNAWGGKQDEISDLADIRTAANKGASAYTNVNTLSGAVVNNYYTTGETYTKSEIDNKIASGGTFDPTTWNALSSATKSHIEDTTVHVTAEDKTTWGNKQDSINDLEAIRSGSLSGGSAYTMVNSLSAATTALSQTVGNAITGVSMNGSNVTVTNKVATLGTVVTAETQLSSASTGNGNVVTDVAVNGHKVTFTKGITAATSTDLNNLSGAVVNNYYTTGQTYTKNEVDQKIASGGTFDPTLWNGLSSATVSHIADTNVHVSSEEKSTWNGKQDNIDDLSTIRNDAQSGASAYTMVKSLSAATTGINTNLTSLSAATTALSQAVGNGITGVSMNGANVTVTNKVAALGTVITAETQLSSASSGNGNVVTSVGVSNHKVTFVKGMTIPAWATASTKPSYTASEVGALPAGTTLDDIPDGTTRKLPDISALSSATVNLSAATTGINTNVTNLSGAVVNNYYTTAQTYTRGEIDNKIASGGTFDPTAWAALSSATEAHINSAASHVSAEDRTSWNAKQDAINDLTAIRNGASSGAAAWTAVTELSGATTALSVVIVNKQDNISDLDAIRNNALSGASAYTKVTSLSAGTIALVGASAATVYSSATSYTDKAIEDLDSSAAVTAGKYITGIAIKDGKISGITEATLPSESQLSTASTGTGNVVTNLTVDGHKITMTKGLTAAALSGLTELSGGTVAVKNTMTAHTADTTIHVTAQEKSTWNGKQAAITDLDTIRKNALSGASAYTRVNTLSGAVVSIEESVAQHIADTTIHVTAEEKTAWNNKQGEISDLDTIRKNALSGASAYTKVIELSAATVSIKSKYLPLSGGILTGSLTVPTATNATDTTKGINFGDASHIGQSSSVFGVYSDGKVVVRPNGATSSASGNGSVEMSTSGFVIYETLIAEKIKKSGGTSSQFLKADGSVDSTAYASTGTVDTLSGATKDHITNGDIHVTSAQKTAWTNGANSGASAWTAVTALSAATTALSNATKDYFDGAEYVSSAKTIVFKHGTTVKSSIDASAFIKDGMVSSVTVSNGNMVVTFNTDAGREDITIPLTDIFNPDNYYTKTEINNGVSASTKSLSASVVDHINSAASHVSASDRTNWNGKQSAISDLATIRNNALSGASAYTRVTNLSAATTAISSTLNTHTADTTIHVTSADKSTWSGKQDAINDLETIRKRANSGASAYTGFIAHSANTDIHVTASDKSTWNGKQDSISDLATIRNNALSGASAYTKVVTLSGITSAINKTLTAHTANTTVHVTAEEKSTWNGKQDAINDLETIRNGAASGASLAGDLQVLSAITQELSGATDAHRKSTTKHVSDSERAKWNHAWTSGVSAYSMVLELSAATAGNSGGITGVTLNDSAATIENRVANLLFTETPITINQFVKGTGNVLTGLEASGHKLTYVLGFSAASSADVATLSAATVNINTRVTNLSATTINVKASVTNLSAATTAISSSVANMKKQFVETTSLSLDLTKSLNVLTITGAATSATISFSDFPTLASGEVFEAQVIVRNAGNVDKTVTIDTGAPIVGHTLVFTTSNTMYIGAGGYAEFNVLVTHNSSSQTTGYNDYIITN